MIANIFAAYYLENVGEKDDPFVDDTFVTFKLTADNEHLLC